MHISTTRFVNASIVRAIEDTEARRLTFEITYPLAEADSDFTEGKLVFELYSRYLVAEPSPTPAIIVAIEVEDLAPYDITVRIRTTRGVREISCAEVSHE